MSTVSQTVLYIIKETDLNYPLSEDGSLWVKIGIAKDPTMRLRQHQTSNPRILKFHKVFHFSNLAFAEICEEALLKKLLEKDFVLKNRSEWFLIDNLEDFTDFVDKVCNLLNKTVEDYRDMVHNL